jgi:HPt (histidine-containing phosphotransfer) domain-containing protein
MNGRQSSASETPFDLEKLARATFGDAGLRAELLEMFDRQLAEAVPALGGCEGADRWRLAHGLKGAARGLGADGLADCAAAIELDPHDDALVERLGDVAREVRRFISQDRV